MYKNRERLRVHLLVTATLIWLLAVYGIPAVVAHAEALGEGATAGAIPIYDVEGLMAMANDPDGTYELKADIDLEGQPWRPIEFRGTLEGGGHAILNAHVSDIAEARRTTYDGNMVAYDTAFSGFFGTLEGASVRNVMFLGVEVDASTNEPSYAGCICGYMDNATIENCMVIGEASLATSGASFGVGGIAGFGNGRIASNTADVTLVCRDLDTAAKDEQFMGGAYANGYADLESNEITIRGFDSDHGYVHDGGMAGMYILYPEGTQYAGTLTNNHVRGFITFFEDNEDRRAYCDPEIGENMSPDNITRGGNTNEFTADERFEYDTDLLPHACANPVWNDQQFASSCNEWGCTQRTCATCGYSYRTAWQPRAHQVTDWSLEGTPLSDGSAVREGSCSQCGTVVYEHVPAEVAASMAQSVASDQVSESQTPLGASESSTAGSMLPLVIAIVALALVSVIVLVVWSVARSRRPTRE